MSDDASQAGPPPATIPDSPPVQTLPQPPIPFDIGEEFGTARKNLPSLKILVTSVAVVALIASIVAYVQRPQQKAKGEIDNVAAVDVPGQDLIMVGLEISIDNQGSKPFLPREVKAEIDTSQGSFNDQAASAVDVPRYVQAYPALTSNGASPLQFESAVQPGAKTKGLIIVTFPISADVFAKRKLLRVTLTGPDQLVPLILTK